MVASILSVSNIVQSRSYIPRRSRTKIYSKKNSDVKSCIGTNEQSQVTAGTLIYKFINWASFVINFHDIIYLNFLACEPVDWYKCCTVPCTVACKLFHISEIPTHKNVIIFYEAQNKQVIISLNSINGRVAKCLV